VWTTHATEPAAPTWCLALCVADLAFRVVCGSLLAADLLTGPGAQPIRSLEAADLLIRASRKETPLATAVLIEQVTRWRTFLIPRVMCWHARLPPQGGR
jgi:hypothetical protein